MKILFFGTAEIAVKSLQSLIEADTEIAAVVTQPDKPVGRKQILTPSPVKEAAAGLNLKILQPENSKELYEEIKDYKVDFLVVFAYGMILPKKILDLPEYGAINIHTSLLPKYRGASPIQEALLKGDKETGVSIMKMNQKMDAGDIYLIRKITIDNNDTTLTLTEKLAELSAEILPLALKDIREKFLTPIPQEDKNASYCKKITKDDGKINWNKPAKDIINQLRAYTPWPGVYTDFEGKKLQIFSAETGTGKVKTGEFHLNGNIMEIGSSAGTIIPRIVQLEGKKAMPIEAFINGRKKS